MTELADFLTAIDTRWLLAGLLLALDAWAIGMIYLSQAPRKDKALWSTIVVLCPIIGCLFWYVLGPKVAPRVAPGAHESR